eukprot:Hpha_TRINITY_DN26182_c0_g1::TRINITY_DN26182_c0_g1_i1::g.155308::m.155308
MAAGGRPGSPGAWEKVEDPVWKEMKVGKCQRQNHCRYLPPGSQEGTDFEVGREPEQPAGTTRVVCISDTHNEHSTFVLPKGDVLIHSGDCLTESGLRHVLRKTGTGKKGEWREIVSVRPLGVELFRRFAEWFGAQPFRVKVLVAGNHDLVIQGLGKEAVQEMLDKYTTHGQTVYLEHSEQSFGDLRIFGSPYANWGSHNDAFRAHDPDFRDVPQGIHIMVQHSPNCLPSCDGRIRDHPHVTKCLQRTGASLHVSGHCHWAHGIYHVAGRTPQDNRIPCVVASICDSHWLFSKDLKSPDGVRGDPIDGNNGGYNVGYPPIVCDLHVPAPPPLDESLPHSESMSTDTPEAGRFREESMLSIIDAFDAPADKPRLLFFGPATDPDAVQRLVPKLSEAYTVDVADNSATGCRMVQMHAYAACVAKLGSKGNLGKHVIEALRKTQGDAAFVAIHSATAARDRDLQGRFRQDLKVNAFFAHDSEDELVRQCAAAAAAQESKPRPRMLFFAPDTDPEARKRLLPKLQTKYEVDCYTSAAEAAQAAGQRPYKACLAKLGSKGNLGCDVIVALRGAQGRAPFVVVHSATAAGNQQLRENWTQTLRVNLFADHSSETDAVEQLLKIATH